MNADQKKLTTKDTKDHKEGLSKNALQESSQQSANKTGAAVFAAPFKFPPLTPATPVFQRS